MLWVQALAGAGVRPATTCPGSCRRAGCATQLASDSFPQTLREAVPTARPEDAYPVCIFGSPGEPFHSRLTAHQSMCLGWSLAESLTGTCHLQACLFLWLKHPTRQQIEQPGSCAAAAIHSASSSLLVDLLSKYVPWFQALKQGLILQMMGWVEASSCRPYNLSAGESAMAFVRPDSAREGGSGAGLQHQHCARALKLAATVRHQQ